MHGVAEEFADALNREATNFDVPPKLWEQELKSRGVSEHLIGHVVTMGELHRTGRYDRLTDGVKRVTGRLAMSVREFVSLHAMNRQNLATRYRTYILGSVLPNDIQFRMQ